MLLHAAPLAATLLLSSAPAQRPAIMAVPLSENEAHAPALTEAVDGALHAAAKAHGFRAARIDSVHGVREGLFACASDVARDECYTRLGKRLGARYVIVGAVTRNDDAATMRASPDELRLTILAEDGARIGALAIAGTGPALVAQVPALVDALVGLATTPTPNPPPDALASPDLDAQFLGAWDTPTTAQLALFDPREPRWDADAGAFYLP